MPREAHFKGFFAHLFQFVIGLIFVKLGNVFFPFGLAAVGFDAFFIYAIADFIRGFVCGGAGGGLTVEGADDALLLVIGAYAGLGNGAAGGNGRVGCGRGVGGGVGFLTGSQCKQ